MTDLFKKELPSHAMLEAKTIKGWMAVDTRDLWIGLTKAGEVTDIAQTLEQLQKGLTSQTIEQPTELSHLGDKAGNFGMVYGLYSRNGNFLRPGRLEAFIEWIGMHIDVPDYNAYMMLQNI